ncbi:short-chain dehydrogenase [Rubrobacter xylanophilus]|uniref:Short-chain dehydrogenase n=1 Tax=Rubrobacter xylanophilus TaxID=49319 RepID=A0A510HIK1_9ACTN|nr:SDR family oxidoreductase [Rubrobacter xylanophilus]BBL79809.1 short-chain dehydrogenase [Rubrobacter xylanophilus]
MRRNVLITGASSGLGRGMAREFAARGCSLALCARRLELLEELREELAAQHPDVRIHIRRLDVNEHAAVFRAFRELDAELGGLDRVVVNAGIGKGQPVGAGYFHANRETVETNFVAALAQCEAAMELFRKRNAGHLVVISSVAAVRGLPGNMTAYSASKAALATLAEGIRADVYGTPIRISTIFPGYIRTQMNERAGRMPFMIGVERGSRLLVEAMEREPARAYVPFWPWRPLSLLLRLLPDGWLARAVS